VLSRFSRLGQPGAADRAIDVLEQSLNLVPLDSHLVNSLYSLSHISSFQGKWDRAAAYLERALQFFEERNDDYGLFTTYCKLKSPPAFQGNWKGVFTVQKMATTTLARLPNLPHLKEKLGWWSGIWALAGRCAEAEQLRDLNTLRKMEAIEEIFFACCELSLALAKQGRFDEAEPRLVEALKITQQVDNRHSKKQSALPLSYWGVIRTRQRRFGEAMQYLTQSLSIKREVQDYPGMPEALNWLGILHECQEQWTTALDHYRQSSGSTGNLYRKSESLLGICRVKCAIGIFADIPSVATEAEQIAQQYEYNDHLASLHLTQGHIAWDGHLVAWGTGFDAALAQYQQALIYALRYNRFLLDEVLWGGDICTPLDPIIPHCLERGAEGRQMLIALRDWWQTGRNDVGQPRPDTISPIPEGIPLLEAEQIARRREPGDGSPQQTVVEKIDRALTAE
jgi:tetratricopeptide (TPR) repeat protein